MAGNSLYNFEPTDPALTETIPTPNFLTSSWDKIEQYLTGRDADTTGMTPAMATTARTGRALRNVGLVTTVLAGVSSAIGTYYAAKTQQYEAKSRASSFAFQSNMAAINASRSETMAQSIEEQGKSEIANYTMRAGQEKAGAVAEMAGHGVALGGGSARDVAASMDLEKDLNVMAIHSNTVRQAAAARAQGTNYRNESLLDRTSSVNALASAGSISPVGNMVNSLLSTATQVAGQWDWNTWMRKRMAAGMPVPQIGLGS